ncbi:MAG: hypothetical protein QOI38_40 [Sphingomonadales bacterium]|jgi:hypothetical protein|nr:hypothetical protein [Sphingomonadales bacterium]
MTWVGILGMVLGLLSYRWAVRGHDWIAVMVFILLYLAHLGSTFYAYQLALGAGSDSVLYYYDPGHWYGQGLKLSTTFVIYLVQWMRAWIGGSYLDYFLLFQLFGLFGIAILMRTFHEIYEELGQPQPLWTYLLLFMPGLHFWTSGIGKDGALFFAACLSIWAATRITQRYIAFAIAIAIMILFRPHIALLAMVAVAASIFFDRRTKGGVKFLLFVAAALTTGFVAATVSSTFNLDVTNADSVSEFLSVRSEASQRSTEGMNTGVLDASFPVRLFSLLFRPIFFDASGLPALIASAENALFLFIVGTLLFHTPKVIRIARAVTYVRYAFAFAALVALLLTIMYYNVGLGLRQKTMFVPAVLVMFVTFRAVYRRAAGLRESGLAVA